MTSGLAVWQEAGKNLALAVFCFDSYTTLAVELPHFDTLPFHTYLLSYTIFSPAPLHNIHCEI